MDSSTPIAALSSVAVCAPKSTVTSEWLTGVAVTVFEPSGTLPVATSETPIATVPMIKAAPTSRERRLGGFGSTGLLARSAPERRDGDVECIYFFPGESGQRAEGGLIVYHDEAAR